MGVRRRVDPSLLPVFEDEVPGYSEYGPSGPPKGFKEHGPVLRKRTRNLGVVCLFVCVGLCSLGVMFVQGELTSASPDTESFWLGVAALVIAGSYVPFGISLLGLWRRLSRRSWRRLRMWVRVCEVLPLACAVAMWFLSRGNGAFALVVAAFVVVPLEIFGFVSGFVVWVDPLSLDAVASDEYAGPSGGRVDGVPEPASAGASAAPSVSEGGER